MQEIVRKVNRRARRLNVKKPYFEAVVKYDPLDPASVYDWRLVAIGDLDDVGFAENRNIAWDEVHVAFRRRGKPYSSREIADRITAQIVKRMVAQEDGIRGRFPGGASSSEP